MQKGTKPRSNRRKRELVRKKPHFPEAREVARVNLRKRTRAAANGKPLTGAYYWVPLPSDGNMIRWKVLEFFDCWRLSSDHVDIWLQIVGSLEFHWSRTIPSDVDYCSLPRGRICRTLLNQRSDAKRPKYALYHGNDCPRGRKGLQQIKRLFNQSDDCALVFDEHEQMISGDPEALSSALGFDLGLHGVRLLDMPTDPSERDR